MKFYSDSVELASWEFWLLTTLASFGVAFFLLLIGLLVWLYV